MSLRQKNNTRIAQYLNSLRYDTLSDGVSGGGKVKTAQTTLSTGMKYSRNLFQFSNGIRAINYSRFIIATNGTKILL